MPVKWRPEALRLYNTGMTYEQIGKELGRSTARVHSVLMNKPYEFKRGKPHGDDTPETKRRRNLRRWCRRAAARNGVPIRQLYREHGVEELDRVKLWEERNG